MGILGCEYGYDNGTGIEVGTPSLFKNRISFRVTVTRNWLEVYKATYDHWANYETVTISIVYKTLPIERGRVYFDLGTYYTFPDRKFAEVKNVQGLTCPTGIELFVVTKPNLNISYSFSGGIGYSHADAKKLENKLRYGNGFVLTNGLRFYF